jgi:hypothetical protein
VETRKKKTLTKNYGSFQLEGLMEKAASKRKELDADQAEEARNERVMEDRNKKAKNDALQFKLCERFCTCPEGPCTWANHIICEEATCGQVIAPMTHCMSAICKAIRQKRKKVAAAAKAVQDKANEVAHARCRGANAVCVCASQTCKWEHWGICDNPPLHHFAGSLQYLQQTCLFEVEKRSRHPSPTSTASKGEGEGEGEEKKTRVNLRECPR